MYFTLKCDEGRAQGKKSVQAGVVINLSIKCEKGLFPSFLVIHGKFHLISLVSYLVGFSRGSEDTHDG